MIWVVLPDFPNYEVSDQGMVRRVGGELRRLIQHRSGYMQVQVRNDRGPSTKLVHRLVAAAFLPAVPGCEFVDHRDSDKTNNAVSNLRWVDLSTNSKPKRVRGKTASARPVPSPTAVWRLIPRASRCTKQAVVGLVRRREICEGSQGFPLRMWASASGYYQVTPVDGKKSTVMVHTLIALVFHGLRPAEHVIDHRDGNKSNNAAINLEYVTRGDNARRFERTITGRTNRGMNKQKLTIADVSDIKLLNRERRAVEIDSSRLSGCSAHAQQHQNWSHMEGRRVSMLSTQPGIRQQAQ
jgi:hypothetical protein